MMLKAIVVDDEELSIKRLRRLLAESGLFEDCRSFQHPLEAYEYAKDYPVDVAFLDISMPNLNGMKLSALLTGLKDEISIVFVTGYESYAVQAFDLNALDYLLKPVDQERLQRTLDKIRKVRGMAEGSPKLAAYLFNGFKLYSESPPRMALKLRSPKTEELFAYLICRRTVSREEAIDALWPTLDRDKALHNLNTNLYYIRKALGADNAQRLIQASRSELAVDSSGILCDVYELERLGKRISDTAGQVDDALIERARELYAGPLLHGRDYAWASEFVRYWEDGYAGMLEAAARHSLAQGRAGLALQYFEELLQLNGLRDDVYGEIIRLCIRMGRKAEALRYYRRLEQMLHAEFGAAPDPAVSKLIGEIGC